MEKKGPIKKYHSWIRWAGNRITFKCTRCGIIRIVQSGGGQFYYDQNNNKLADNPGCKVSNPTAR